MMAEETTTPVQAGPGEADSAREPLAAVPGPVTERSDRERKDSPLLLILIVLLILIGIADAILWGVVGYYLLRDSEDEPAAARNSFAGGAPAQGSFYDDGTPEQGSPDDGGALPQGSYGGGVPQGSYDSGGLTEGSYVGGGGVTEGSYGGGGTTGSYGGEGLIEGSYGGGGAAGSYDGEGLAEGSYGGGVTGSYDGGGVTAGGDETAAQGSSSGGGAAEKTLRSFLGETMISVDEARQEGVAIYLQEMIGMEDYEQAVLESYGSVSGENYTDDAAMYAEISERTLSLCRKWAEAARTVRLSGTDDDAVFFGQDLPAVHKIYQDYIQKYLSALTMRATALRNQDDGQVVEADNLFGEADALRANYRQALERAARERNYPLP